MASNLAPKATHGRLLPSFLCGLLAAIASISAVLALHQCESLLMDGFIYGASLFSAAFVAVLFAPSRILGVWVVLYIGLIVGVAVHALAYEALAYGSRNLWPLEIVIVGSVGFFPSALGLWLGKRAQAHRAASVRGTAN